MRATVDLCVDLLEGADRNDHPDAMPYLTGVVFDEKSPIFYPAQWKDYWVRTWGARGLLYVWDDSAAPAVVAGLDDEHWRPAEMCLKVSTKRELGEAGPRAAELAVDGELPRVRVQALRTLGAVGDTEHVDGGPGLARRRGAGRTPPGGALADPARLAARRRRAGLERQSTDSDEITSHVPKRLSPDDLASATDAALSSWHRYWGS